VSLSVRHVTPADIYDLRRRVLRSDDPTADVGDPRDHDEDARHYGAFLGDRIVGCGSIYTSTSPVHPEVPTHQLRYLATDFDVQGQGVGAAILTMMEAEAFARGAREIWANGRDTALGFYRRLGWHLVEGSEHLSPYTGLPHTVIWKALGNEG